MERKRRGRGRAAILSPAQLEKLIQYSPPRYKLLWAICYFAKCRVSEALQLTRSDIVDGRIIFERETIKREKKTREVEITSQLAAIMDEYGLPATGYIFPGEQGQQHFSRQAADLQLRLLCKRLGYKGFISYYSFYRTSAARLNDPEYQAL